jgi:N-carbamoylputrescine amidase
VQQRVWDAASRAHQAWQERFADLSPAAVLSTFPMSIGSERLNEAFVWESGHYRPVHHKHYLPNEPGFWEATWCSRGDGTFSPTLCAGARLGFLVCTELWSIETARQYGRAGAHLLVSPRASMLATVEKWLVAGRAAAIVAGAYSLSSNRRGQHPQGIEFGGTGWVIDPEGTVLGMTSQEQPFVTVDVDLERAEQAKGTYPRYVFM